MFSGAINGVGTITNAVASGVSSGVVGTVGAVSDGVDAVAYGVTGGETNVSFSNHLGSNNFNEIIDSKLGLVQASRRWVME